MATIGKITTAKSGSAAINYALGKDKMPDDTKQWLLDNGVPDEIVETLHDRAVTMDGWNVDPEYAKEQMRASRNVFKTTGREVTRIIQSFPESDLEAFNVSDWDKANQLGLELAKKAFPDYQVAIYTHVDGTGHKLHNHLVINMPNLQTGKKYHEHRSWERISAINDEIAREHGFSVVDRGNQEPERHTMAERKRAEKGQYVWKDDLRQRIDQAMTELGSNEKSLEELLDNQGVNYKLRGKNVTYTFTDKDQKERKARGTSLGRDYERETIDNELERQAKNHEQSGLEPITATIKQVAGEQQNLIEQQQRIATGLKQENKRKQRLRETAKRLGGKIRELEEPVREFVARVKENDLYKSFESKLQKAKEQKAERDRQNALKREQQRQAQQRYSRNRGGRSR